MIAGCFGLLGTIDVANNYLGFLNKKSKIIVFTSFLIILVIGLIINSCVDRYKMFKDLDEVTINRNALKANLRKKQREVEDLQSKQSEQNTLIQTLIQFIPRNKLGDFRNQLFVNETIYKYKDDKNNENSKNY